MSHSIYVQIHLPRLTNCLPRVKPNFYQKFTFYQIRYMIVNTKVIPFRYSLCAEHCIFITRIPLGPRRGRGGEKGKKKLNESRDRVVSLAKEGHFEGQFDKCIFGVTRPRVIFQLVVLVFPKSTKKDTNQPISRFIFRIKCCSTPYTWRARQGILWCGLNRHYTPEENIIKFPAAKQ